jgi:signal transduction histidine kinase
MKPQQRAHAFGIRRIAISSLVLVWMAINVCGVYYISREHELVEQTVLAVTASQGQGLADESAEALAERNYVRLRELVNMLGLQRGVQGVWITDQNGVTVAVMETEGIRRAPDMSTSSVAAREPEVVERHPKPGGFFHESGHNFDLSFPIRRDGELLGTLGIEINTAWANLEAKALAQNGLLALLLMTIVFALVALWVDRLLVRNIRRLGNAIQGMADGELGQHVHLGTRDELEELGESVNLLAEGLRQSEARVQHWRTRLEHVIAERSEQLEASQTLLARQEKMAALGLMAAGVAHEVGNPLAAISAIVQRIEWNAEPKLRKKCVTIRQQIDRISKTIDELRQFARPSPGESEIPVNVNDVLRLALQICRYDPRGKNVAIETDFDPTLPPVHGNPDRWQQVFLNLLLNAFDAMPQGGVLSVASQHRDGNAVLIFKDTGMGMSREQLQKLFQPFYSTKSPDRGSGLGLAVCDGIVRSYGGEIRVESTPGQGTEFRIIVPTNRTASISQSPAALRRMGEPQDVDVPPESAALREGVL